MSSNRTTAQSNWLTPINLQDMISSSTTAVQAIPSTSTNDEGNLYPLGLYRFFTAMHFTTSESTMLIKLIQRMSTMADSENNYTEPIEASEGDNMNEDKYLEAYISKIDEDRRALQNEFKEREARIEKQIENSESRIDTKFDKIENLIIDQNNKIEKLISDQNNKIDSLKDEVRTQLSEDKKYRHTNNIAIVIGVVTTVVALIGIYYATVSTITDLLGLVK